MYLDLEIPVYFYLEILIHYHFRASKILCTFFCLYEETMIYDLLSGDESSLVQKKIDNIKLPQKPVQFAVIPPSSAIPSLHVTRQEN